MGFRHVDCAIIYGNQNEVSPVSENPTSALVGPVGAHHFGATDGGCETEPWLTGRRSPTASRHRVSLGRTSSSSPSYGTTLTVLRMSSLTSTPPLKSSAHPISTHTSSTGLSLCGTILASWSHTSPARRTEGLSTTMPPGSKPPGRKWCASTRRPRRSAASESATSPSSISKRSSTQLVSSRRSTRSSVTRVSSSKSCSTTVGAQVA